jgi:cytochrome c553
VGSDTVGRIERVMVAFDTSVLEPENAALSRLNIDGEKYGKYLDAFVQQMRELAAQADNLVDEASLLAFQRKCGVCHNAAGVIGSPRVARLVGQAMTDATQDLDRAVASAKLAAYWLQRVAGERRRGG